MRYILVLVVFLVTGVLHAQSTKRKAVLANKSELLGSSQTKGFDYLTSQYESSITKKEVYDGWKLVWADEFNYKGLPNNSKWNYDIGGNGWGNNESQFYTSADTLNAKVENGVLSIIARKQNVGSNTYTSARLTTKDRYSIKYGRIEIKAKFPSGKGLWPAIWMLPSESTYGIWPKSGEIDIAENVGFQTDTLHGSVHTNSFNHLQNTQKTTEVALPRLYSSFHVYRIDWDLNKIDFYVDNQRYMTFENTKNGVDEWPFDQHFYLLLNVAIGGNWGGKQGIDDTIFPVEMQVDYVRMFKKDN